MAINGIDSPSDPIGKRISESTGRQSGESTGPDKTKAQTGASGDHVSITADGARMLEIEAAIGDVPDVDIDKVNRVKGAIDSGEYAVDSDRVARQMLEFDRALSEQDDQ